MVASFPACKAPKAPASMDSQSNETLANYQQIWPVMMRHLSARAQCDLFSFGNVVVTMGGDIYPATYMGQIGHQRPRAVVSQLPNSKHAEIASVIQWEMQMIAQFLDKMNKIPDPQDPDGKTLLANTTMLIGTELERARDPFSPGMTFFMAGAKGRFRGGTQNVGSRPDTDLYNTVLTKLTGVPSTTFGKKGTYTGQLSI